MVSTLIKAGYLISFIASLLFSHNLFAQSLLEFQAFEAAQDSLDGSGVKKIDSVTNDKYLPQDKELKKDKKVANKNPLAQIDDVLLNKKEKRSDELESLMFDKKEIKDIRRAISAYNNKESFVVKGSQSVKEVNQDLDKVEENRRSHIYLSSIIYFSKNSWIIWIDNNKITTRDNKEENEIFIKKVDGDGVEVVWNMTVSKWVILSGKTAQEATKYTNENNQIQVEFYLRPNQTYMLRSNRVVEGRIL